MATIFVAISGSTAQSAEILFSTGDHPDPIELSLNPSYGSTEHTGSTGLLSLIFGEIDNDDWMQVEIANTTSPQIGSRLTAAGFELPGFIEVPLSFASDGEDDFFDVLSFDVSVSPDWLNVPGGYGLMITSDGNFEGGNPHGAPQAGESRWVTINLGDTGRSPVQLASAFRTFFIEAEGSVAIGRFQSAGPEGEDSDKVVGSIPEPGTVVLMSCSALALLLRSRRRTK